ncbi:BrnT family toxin [Microbulbifer sp. SH-1]|uniref:BrnT family toxin n=1 Tax=Microbulbifer sp. SH-1 TaxID=2681547 RepID=UPI00140843FB|nr:BrnT family toxin [Microbulbifer sp. SH-1]QIL91398.1 BrnT family toxin [Microbulbifer sp. SH-1]
MSFRSAAAVFKDKNQIAAEDERKDYGEVRMQVIGEAKPGILFVVYTERDSGNAVRLISARKANRKERAIYNSLPGV